MSEEFEAAFNDANVGMAILGVDGSWLAANQALCDTLRFARSDLVSRPFRDLVHPDDRASHDDALAALASGGTARHEAERRYVRSDGTVGWARCALTRIPATDTRSERVLCRLTDVTGEVESRSLTELVFLASPDPIVVCDADGVLVKVSRSYAALFGMTPEEAAGHPITDVVHPDDVDRTLAECREAARSDSVVEGFENRNVLPDGSVRWFEWNAAAVQDSGLLLCIARDVTARNEYATSLSHERDFSAATLDNASALVVVCDAQGVIVRVNKAVEALLGVPAPNIVGKYVYEVFDVTAEPVSNWQATLRNGYRGDSTTVPVADGTVRTIRWAASSVTDDDGNIEHVIAVGDDITDDLARSRRLHEMSAMLNLAFDRAPIASVVLSLSPGSEGTVINVNNRVVELSGLPASSIIGMNAVDLIAREQRDEARRSLTHRIANGPYTVERKFDLGAGKTLWGKVTVAAAGGDGTDVDPFAVVQIEDVTEQREADRQLKEVTEQFRVAFEQAPIGMCLVGVAGDNVGVLVQANDMLAEIAGVRPKDMLGTRADQWFMPDEQGDSRDKLVRLAAGSMPGDRYAALRRIRRSDGTLRSVKTSVALSRDIDGNPLLIVAQVEDVTEQREAQERISHMAMHDALTGLPNRTLALDRIQLAQARSDRDGQHIAVLFMDLDRFKNVNDSLGHDAGDDLLCAAAERIVSVLRPSDTAARIGGDEFVVCLDGLHADSRDALKEARETADRLIATLSAPFEIGSEQVHVSVSIGVRVTQGTDRTPDELLRDADTAMYRAKGKGRSCVEVFDARLRNDILNVVRVEHDLRDAIANGELVPYYQPILDMRTNQFVGAEALVRWIRPGEGVIPPLSFLPVAEESGLIHQIGVQVLRQACRDVAEIRRRVRPGFSVSVNVSPRQLYHDVASEVFSALADAGVDTSAVAVEITEETLFDASEDNLAQLTALREAGVSLSIDDFGTGFSSLSSLRRLPFTVLKIDREFISGLPDEAEAATITSSVLAMAASLGLATVAEGVETEEQRSWLAGKGCVQAQGFLLARPMPFADLLEFLASAD